MKNLTFALASALSVMTATFDDRIAVAKNVSVECQFVGDVIIETKSGELLSDWQIAKFTPFDWQGSRTVDPKGMCSLRMDTESYRWIGCFKDGGQYKNDSNRVIEGNILEVVKSAYPRCYRCSDEERGKWHGGCKINR